MSIVAQIILRLQQALVAAFGEDLAETDPMLAATNNPKFGDYQSNLALSLSKKLGEIGLIVPKFRIVRRGQHRVRLHKTFSKRSDESLLKTEGNLGDDAHRRGNDRGKIGLETRCDRDASRLSRIRLVYRISA